MVVAKSPLTGGWGEANSGGYFGSYLKFAGFDGVFFTVFLRNRYICCLITARLRSRMPILSGVKIATKPKIC